MSLPLSSNRKRRSGRVAHLRHAYGEAVETAFRADNPMRGYFRLWRKGTADAVFDFVLAFDPTPKAIYLQTILRWFVARTIRIEDGRKVRDTLARFDACKRFLADGERDINTYVSPGQVGLVLATLDGAGFRIPLSMPVEVLQGSTVVASGADWSIRRLDTAVASEWWADSTDWCTRHPRHFQTYRNLGFLYVIEHAGRKLQVSDVSDQLMDEKDEDGIGVMRQVFPAEARSALISILLHDRLNSGPAFTGGMGLPRKVEGELSGTKVWMLPVLSRNVMSRLHGLETQGGANYIVVSERGLEAYVCLNIPVVGKAFIHRYLDGHADGRVERSMISSGAELSSQAPEIRQIMALVFKSAAGQRIDNAVALPSIGRRGPPVFMSTGREFGCRLVETLTMQGSESARHWVMVRGDEPLAMVSIRANLPRNVEAYVRPRFSMRMFGHGPEFGTVRDLEWEDGRGSSAMEMADDIQARIVHVMFRHLYPGSRAIVDIGPEILSSAAANHWFGELSKETVSRGAEIIKAIKARDGIHGFTVAHSVVDRCIDLVAPSSAHALAILAHPSCVDLDVSSDLRKRLMARCTPTGRRLLQAYASMTNPKVPAPDEALTTEDLFEVSDVPGVDHLFWGVDLFFGVDKSEVSLGLMSSYIAESLARAP